MSRLHEIRPTNPGSLALGSCLEVCPGMRHAWLYSSIGPIRKPIANQLLAFEAWCQQQAIEKEVYSG